MTIPEVYGSVIDEFEEIVLSHISAHRHDQFAKILCIAVVGTICHWIFNSMLISMVLIAYAAKILYTKPDLTADVSYDEVTQLSDSARAAFDRIFKNKWNGEPVRVSDLNSIVRDAAKKSEAARKAYRKAVWNRQARESQERALYKKRDEMNG